MSLSAWQLISNEVNSGQPPATMLNVSKQGLIQILPFLPRFEEEFDLHKYLHTSDTNMCSRLKKTKHYLDDLFTIANNY